MKTSAGFLCGVYVALTGLVGGGGVIPGLRHAFSVPCPGLFPFVPTGAPDRCYGMVRGLTESRIVDVLAGSYPGMALCGVAETRFWLRLCRAGLFSIAPAGAPDRCDGMVRGLTESRIVDV